MDAISIKLNKNQEVNGLEEILGPLPVFKRIGSLYWNWSSGCGDVIVIAYKSINSIEISASNYSGILQKRMFKVLKRIKNHYSNCRVEYNKDFRWG